MADDASILRTVMARECDTVNEYEALAAQAQSEGVRRLMLHIAREEREHIAVCARYLAELDGDFDRFLQAEHPPLDAEGRKLAGCGGGGAASSAAGSSAAGSSAAGSSAAEPPAASHKPAAPPAPSIGPALDRFTIGSLISR